MSRIKWEHIIGLVGVLMMIGGHYAGLFVAPPEKMMGDVGRIFYVHVPVAILSMMVFSLSGLAAFGYLMTGRMSLDWLVEATVEIGIMASTLLLILGSVWARPTWGVWWTWDPRLITSTVLLLTFVGVMLLRGATTNPEQRATWCSVATLFAWVNVPITYQSVKWWRSVHQLQTPQDAISDPMRYVYYENLIAMILVLTWFIVWRWRIAKHEARSQAPEPLPEKVIT